MKPILEVLKLAKINYMMVVWILGLALFSSYFSILPIQAVAFLADSYFNTSGLSSTYPVFAAMMKMGSFGNNTGIGSSLAIFVLITIVSLLARNYLGYLGTQLTENAIYRIRNRLYSDLLSGNIMKLQESQKGELITALNTDTRRLELLLAMPLFTLLSDIFDMLWITFFLLKFSVAIPVLLVVVLPVMYKIVLYGGQLQNRYSKEIRGVEGQIATRSEQSLTNIEIIRVFGTLSKEASRYEHLGESTKRLRVKSTLIKAAFFSLEGLMRAVVIAACIYIYLKYNSLGSSLATASTVVVLFQYITRFFAPITNFTHYYQTMQMGVVSWGNLKKYGNWNDGAETAGHPTGLKVLSQHDIVMDRFTVNRNSAPLFEPINLRIPAGSFVIVSGSSGIGKSTLLKTLLKINPAYSGSLKIGGHEIVDLPESSIPDLFSFAGQSAYLNNDTILNNVLYATEADGSTTKKATALLEELQIPTDQHQTLVNEGATSLSGGEARRLILCRALVTHRPVLLLDEVTANLDAFNQDVIHRVLHKIKGTATVIVVTHSKHPDLLSLADHVIELVPVGGGVLA